MYTFIKFKKNIHFPLKLFHIPIATLPCILSYRITVFVRKTIRITWMLTVFAHIYTFTYFSDCLALLFHVIFPRKEKRRKKIRTKNKITAAPLKWEPQADLLHFSAYVQARRLYTLFNLVPFTPQIRGEFLGDKNFTLSPIPALPFRLGITSRGREKKCFYLFCAKGKSRKSLREFLASGRHARY